MHRQTWACFRELTRIKSNSFSRQFIAEGSNQLLINTRQTEIGLWSWEPQHFSKLLKHPSIEFILTCGQVFQSSSVISECRSDWELFGKRPLMSLYKKKKKKRNQDRHKLKIYSGLKWTRQMPTQRHLIHLSVVATERQQSHSTYLHSFKEFFPTGISFHLFTVYLSIYTDTCHCFAETQSFVRFELSTRHAETVRPY